MTSILNRGPLFNDKRYIRSLIALTRRKELGDLDAGLNGIHAWMLLDGETLAPLSTTGSENSATTLGGHAGTETVALGALAFVRLVGAFHCFLSLSWFKE